MITDSTLVKALNLPRTSPTFAYQQQADGSLAVVNPKTIEDDGSIYWVAGTTTLPRRQAIPSVFIVENGGETLLTVYWYIAGSWYQSDDPDAIDALRVPRDQIFPFDWSYAIPVTNDTFHD